MKLWQLSRMAKRARMQRRFAAYKRIQAAFLRRCEMIGNRDDGAMRA